MKRIILTCVFCLMFVLPASAKQQIVGLVTGAGGLGDMSFNDIAYGGLRNAQRENGFRLIVLEADDTGTVSREKVLELAHQCDVVVLLGAQHTAHAKALSAKFPHKHFIFYEQTVPESPNMTAIMFKHNEGSYLVGVLAGRMSKTGNIGFLGGTDIPQVRAFALGFEAGIKKVAPNAMVDIQFVTPAGDYSGFTRPDIAHKKALEMHEQGVDVIFAVAGLSGNGVIEAARQIPDLYAIGVDADQDDMAKGKVLTSMIKRMDVATYAEVLKAVTGQAKGGIVEYGLSNGGVSLSDMRFTKDIIPEAVHKEISELRARIISGEIIVPDTER